MTDKLHGIKGAALPIILRTAAWAPPPLPFELSDSKVEPPAASRGSVLCEDALSGRERVGESVGDTEKCVVVVVVMKSQQRAAYLPPR